MRGTRIRNGHSKRKAKWGMWGVSGEKERGGTKIILQIAKKEKNQSCVGFVLVDAQSHLHNLPPLHILQDQTPGQRNYCMGETMLSSAFASLGSPKSGSPKYSLIPKNK